MVYWLEAIYSCDSSSTPFYLHRLLNSSSSSTPWPIRVYFIPFTVTVTHSYSFVPALCRYIRIISKYPKGAHYYTIHSAEKSTDKMALPLDTHSHAAAAFSTYLYIFIYTLRAHGVKLLSLLLLLQLLMTRAHNRRLYCHCPPHRKCKIITHADQAQGWSTKNCYHSELPYTHPHLVKRISNFFTPLGHSPFYSSTSSSAITFSALCNCCSSSSSFTSPATTHPTVSVCVLHELWTKSLKGLSLIFNPRRGRFQFSHTRHLLCVRRFCTWHCTRVTWGEAVTVTRLTDWYYLHCY